jgi:O-antigen ligase
VSQSLSSTYAPDLVAAEERLWRAPLVALLLVILFIPIRRYTMPADLPFELEPYRLLVVALAVCWFLALLADPRTRLHSSGLEAPLFSFTLAALGSVLVNQTRVEALRLDANVVKTLTFFASFVVVFYFVVSVARRMSLIDLAIRVLVVGGGVLAVCAVVESRTGFNLFDHLEGRVPFLQLSFPAEIPPRGARLRAYASAQHPIALAAALVMLVPLALYLARSTARRRWYLVAGVLAVGALSTVSRTSIVMLVVVILVFLWLRPRETLRWWPVLVPAVVVVHLAIPGTIGTLRSAFFPQGGLVAEQSAAGRIEDFAPSRAEFARQPFLGQGYGTRQVTGEQRNARFLDNQWLGTLLETGLAGALSLLWLFVRAIRRASRAAKQDATSRGWLLTAIAASVMAYAVGMFTFDAFSFIQVTFLLFILLGLGSILVSQESPSPAPAGCGHVADAGPPCERQDSDSAAPA